VCYTGLSLASCPGFGQDRVNFHQKLRGHTAGLADPNWPNKTGYSIPCAAMLGSVWGSWPGGSQSWLGSALGSGWWVALCIPLFVLYILLIHIAVITVCFICCSVKLTLSQSMSFCLFLSILLPTPVVGGPIEWLRGPLLLATVKLQHFTPPPSFP